MSGLKVFLKLLNTEVTPKAAAITGVGMGFGIAYIADKGIFDGRGLSQRKKIIKEAVSLDAISIG